MLRVTECRAVVILFDLDSPVAARKGRQHKVSVVCRHFLARCKPVNKMEDDFGDDADFSAVVAAVEKSHRPLQPVSSTSHKIQQPTPQALPSRSTPSAILVSPRQKGNPILTSIRSLPWEYSDIPSDYVLGATTCALFLSLKYHRLHPEYIYSRIRALAGKYNLRILLTMVDIQNHEESLKELSKTSLVNNLTLILTWSASEAGRYLELFKSYEHASPTSIRAHQTTSYAEKLIEFITVPRSINKTDAVGLVSAFGSVRAAVNARPEEIGSITGWGEKKVERWCGTVREPFRVQKATKRGLEDREAIWRREESSRNSLRRQAGADQHLQGQPAASSTEPECATPSRAPPTSLSEQQPNLDIEPPAPRPAKCTTVDEASPTWSPVDDEEEAFKLLAAAEEADNAPPLQSSNRPLGSSASRGRNEGMTEGMIAALAQLRKA